MKLDSESLEVIFKNIIGANKSYELPKNIDFQAFLELYTSFLENSKENPVQKNIPLNSLIKKIQDKIDLKGVGEEEFLSLLKGTILNYSKNLHNPKYTGHLVPPSLPLAVMIDMLISGWNQSLVVSRMSPVMTFIEKELLNFLAATFGYSAQAKGTITSGGSVSNLLGILAARNKYFGENSLEKATIVCFEQSHYSIQKAAFICGIKKQNVVSIPCNENFSMDASKVEPILEKIKNEGKEPFILIATSGSTATGSFDDIEKLYEISKKHNLWLHVDAAHGGSLIFSKKYNPLLKGINLADSISVDGHKMMFMPSSMGIFLAKEGAELQDCFDDIDAPYIYNNQTSEHDLSKLSIQCTRRADALKLWGSLVTYGTEFFSEKIEYLSSLAEFLYKELGTKEDFQVLHKPEFNILCFRYCPKGKTNDEVNKINYKIREYVNNSGKTMITITSINNNFYLRTAFLNPATKKEHIREIVGLIEQAGKNLIKNP